MYRKLLKDFKEGKTFPKIGAIKLVDIRVILNKKIVYEGPVSEASDEIKNLYYYKTEMNNGKLILYVNSKLCKKINKAKKKKEKRKQSQILEQQKKEYILPLRPEGKYIDPNSEDYEKIVKMVTEAEKRAQAGALALQNIIEKQKRIDKLKQEREEEEKEMQKKFFDDFLEKYIGESSDEEKKEAEELVKEIELEDFIEEYYNGRDRFKS